MTTTILRGLSAVAAGIFGALALAPGPVPAQDPVDPAYTPADRIEEGGRVYTLSEEVKCFSFARVRETYLTRIVDNRTIQYDTAPSRIHRVRLSKPCYDIDVRLGELGLRLGGDRLCTTNQYVHLFTGELCPIETIYLYTPAKEDGESPKAAKEAD